MVVPHIAATVALRRYAPGGITALAINLPLCTTLLVRAIAGGFVTLRQPQEANAVAAAAVETPLLFAVARRVFGRRTR